MPRNPYDGDPRWNPSEVLSPSEKHDRAMVILEQSMLVHAVGHLRGLSDEEQIPYQVSLDEALRWIDRYPDISYQEIIRVRPGGRRI